MGLVYLPTWKPWKSTFHVGKYTIVPWILWDLLKNHPQQTRCQTFSLQMKWNRWIETEKTSVGYVFFFWKFCQGERVTCFSRDVKRKQNKPRSMLYAKHEGWVYIYIQVWLYIIYMSHGFLIIKIQSHTHTHTSSIFREWPDGKRPYLLGPRRKPCDSKAS